MIGNWKMNPASIGEAKRLFLEVKKVSFRRRNAHTIICPPAAFLAELRKLYIGKRIAFGAQNIFAEPAGAYTGEISADMVSSVGASYVILGHSERRAMGETNEEIGRKVDAALVAGLKVILCVGESDRDEHGEYLSYLREELFSALLNVSRQSLKHIFIAYEPLWAIGKTGADAIQPSDLHGTVIFLRKILAEKYDKRSAFALTILYGGSVESENAQALLEEGSVSGFLVGHASLSADEFGAILNIADAHAA